VLLLVASCGPRNSPDRVPGEEARPAAHFEAIPDALLVRFEDVHGEGFSRESWEIEVLQMGSDIHVRGSLRTAGASVPVFRTLSRAEYERFWQWMKEFPLEDLRVEESVGEPEETWRKTFEVDVVLPTKRIRSRNRWVRPLHGNVWISEVENHLHQMLLDYVEEELDKPPMPPDSSASPGAGANEDDPAATPREAMTRDLKSR
jgi:hypothetical protein